MTLKKFGALLLAGAMMTGTIGVMSPTQAKAATSANTYTMTVPSNMDIEKSGWNSLGNIKISGPVDSIRKVTVTATTTNGFKLMDEDGNSVSYTMKTEEDGSAQTSFEFDATSINADGGASKEIGVDVDDFAGKPAGTYTDTIQFTAEGLLWSADDCFSFVLKDDTYEYAVALRPIKKYEGVVPCQRHKISDGDDWDNDDRDILFDLKKDGNVFTLTSKDARADFDITINFSDQTCSIQGNSSYNFIEILHVEMPTNTIHWWGNNYQP